MVVLLLLLLLEDPRTKRCRGKNKRWYTRLDSSTEVGARRMTRGCICSASLRTGAATKQEQITEHRKARNALTLHLRSNRLYTVTGPELLLYDGRERRHLSRPALGVVLLEATQQLLEHRVQLRRRVIPLDYCIAEP